MATPTAMKGLVGAAQANVRAEEESMDPVKLIASDGTEVILDRRAAMVSGTIKAMLAGPGAGAAPSLLLSRRSNVAMPTSQAISPRRSRARSSSRRSRGTSSRRSAHPRLLTGAPVRSSSAPKLSLSPRHRPHPGSPAIASILAVGPAPVPACAWSCLSSLGTFVADGAVLLLQAALHESPGHASRVQDRAGERVGAADGR